MAMQSVPVPTATRSQHIPNDIRRWIHQCVLRVRMGDAPTRGNQSAELRDENDRNIRWVLAWYESKSQHQLGYVETLWTLNASYGGPAHFRDISDDQLLRWISEADKFPDPPAQEEPLESKPETYGGW